MLEAEYMLMGILSIGKAARDVNHELIPHGFRTIRENLNQGIAAIFQKGSENIA